jgi:hypothetical protein
MSFNLKVGAVTGALIALIAFQNVNPAYAGHSRPAPAIVSPFNVKDFGAKGDGVTDDTNAIQNAANTAFSNHRGVFFPPGNYLHANFITFNGVAVTGSGAASVLLAVDPNNTTVVLTGSNPSMQNMVISTAGLGLATPTPNTATLSVQNANSFTVANDTIVQGLDRVGIWVTNSSVGLVNACACDGTGNPADTGIVVGQSHNISVTGNQLQNEGTGIYVDPALPASQSIALLSNGIGNVTYPTRAYGIEAEGVSSLDIANNAIQIIDSSTGFAIWARNSDSFNISNNDTWGGLIGIRAEASGPSGNVVNQNTIHNCGLQAIALPNIATSAVQVTGNQFGECGLQGSGPSVNYAVIIIYGDPASGATTFVQNNSYQGHTNGLQSKVTCTFTAPHIPAANVTGNTQTQTVLMDHI